VSDKPPGDPVQKPISKHYAGTGVAKRHEAQKNASTANEQAKNANRKELPMEVQTAFDWIRDPKNVPAVNTVITFLIFVATASYVVFACLQWRIMGDTLELEERPWVGIYSGEADSFVMDASENHPLKVQLKAKNVGKSPAFNLVAVAKMQTVGPQGKPPIFDNYSKSEAGTPSTIFPNSVTYLTVDTTKKSAEGNSFPSLQKGEVEAIKSGIVRVYAYGSIWYEDGLSNLHWYGAILNLLRSSDHRTDYCFAFVPSQGNISTDHGTWAACDTHNYAD
jgi:hypothetical protein